MRPEEFNREMRDHVRENFIPYVEFVEDAISDRGTLTEQSLARFLEDPGGALARGRIIGRRDRAEVNELVLAIYNSPSINRHLREATEDLSLDRETLEIYERLAIEPEQVPVEDVNRVLDLVLREDSLVTGTIRALLNDEGVRRALDVPSDLTFEAYMQRLRRTIRDASSIEEIGETGRLGPDGPAVVTAVAAFVGIAVFVVIAVIVSTGAVAVNYVGALNIALALAFAVWKVATVFTVSGQDYSAGGFPVAGLTATTLESNCINESDKTIWVVVPTELGLKRVPLPPSKTSAGVGLPAVAAIVIGGEMNPLRSVLTERDGLCCSGAYILARDATAPSEVVVRPTSGGFELEVNDAQSAAERAGMAGYSDLDGGGSAGGNFDPRFRMGGVAAALPAALDFNGLVNDTLDAQHYYTTLCAARVATSLRGTLADA